MWCLNAAYQTSTRPSSLDIGMRCLTPSTASGAAGGANGGAHLQELSPRVSRQTGRIGLHVRIFCGGHVDWGGMLTCGEQSTVMTFRSVRAIGPAAAWRRGGHDVRHARAELGEKRRIACIASTGQPSPARLPCRAPACFVDATRLTRRPRGGAGHLLPQGALQAVSGRPGRLSKVSRRGLMRRIQPCGAAARSAMLSWSCLPHAAPNRSRTRLTAGA